MFVGSTSKAQVVGHSDARGHRAVGCDLPALDRRLVDRLELLADLAGSARAAEINNHTRAEALAIPGIKAPGKLLADLLVVWRDDD